MPPNILLIISDDQRAEPDGAGNTLMDAMPVTKSVLGTGGTYYSRAVNTTPTCRPARCSIYSGLYPFHSQHRTFDNLEPPVWNTWYSIQRLLGEAGYRTGLDGKYINGVATGSAPYFGYARDVAQDASEIANHVAYVTEFLADPDPRPWFLVFAPYSPHDPYNVTAAATPPAWVPPDAFTDVPPYDKRPDIGSASITEAEMETLFENQWEECAGLDEGLDQIFDLIDLDATAMFYLSDNGYEWGDHGLRVKQFPYLESVRTDLYHRHTDGAVAAGATVTELVANIDVAPTICEIAEVTPDYPMQGRSLYDAARSDDEGVFTMFPAPEGVGYHAWRSIWLPDNTFYTQWRVEDDLPDGFIEKYDLDADPYQLAASNDADSALDELFDWAWPGETARSDYVPAGNLMSLRGVE